LGHDAQLTAMAVSPDSQYIATGANDGTVVIWSRATSPQRHLVETQCPARSGCVRALHFSDTGQLLAGMSQHEVFIWRVDGSLISAARGPEENVACVWWTRGPEFPILLRTNDSSVRNGPVSDVCSTGYTFLHGHTGEVVAGCISPCERYIATASEDTTVRLWSARHGSLIWTFVDHDAAVTHVLFSPDGQFLASGDHHGQVCVHLLSRFLRDPPLPPATVDEYRERCGHAGPSFDSNVRAVTPQAAAEN
ncbi:WD40 repeat-like protein, partial [Polyporus arcularius HHB13444]